MFSSRAFAHLSGSSRVAGILVLVGIPVLSLAGDFGTASKFNAFIFNDFTGNSHTENSVAIGGNFYGHLDAAQHTALGTLGGVWNVGMYVGGSFQGSGDTHVEQKSDVYLGSKTSGNILNANSVTVKNSGNASTFNAMAADFTATKNNLTATSNLIADSTSFAKNANAIDFSFDFSDQNNAKFHGVSLGNKQNLQIDFSKFNSVGTFSGTSVYVLNISDADLAAFNSNVSIVEWQGLDATHTLYLNFTGTGSVLWNTQIQTTEANKYTLFNAAKATDFYTSPLFTGSILTPAATVHQGGGDIQGQIFANNFIQGNEVHWDAGNGFFQGYVPPAPAATPEPATMAIAGLGIAAALRRRKRA